jgi:hypothetical protein
LIVAQTTMHAYAHATAPTARSRENCNVAATSAPFPATTGLKAPVPKLCAAVLSLDKAQENPSNM